LIFCGQQRRLGHPQPIERGQTTSGTSTATYTHTGGSTSSASQPPHRRQRANTKGQCRRPIAHIERAIIQPASRNAARNGQCRQTTPWPRNADTNQTGQPRISPAALRIRMAVADQSTAKPQLPQM
jgi:hypothetical protein